MYCGRHSIFPSVSALTLIFITFCLENSFTVSQVSSGKPSFTSGVTSRSYTFNPASQTSLTIPASAFGVPKPVISWWKNDQRLTFPVTTPSGEVLILLIGSTSSGFVTSSSLNVTASVATLGNHGIVSGWYTCMAANSQGITRMDFLLTVLVAPIIVSPPKKTECFKNTPFRGATFHCTVAGYPFPAVTWQLDTHNVTASTGVIFSRYNSTYFLTLTSVNSTQLGQYTCTASSIAGRTTSSNARLKVLSFSLDKMFTSRNRLYHVNIDPSAPSGTTRFNFDLQKHGVNNYMWYLNGVGIQIGQNGWSVNSDSDNLLVLQQSDSKKNLNTDDVGELTLRAISSSKGDYSTNKFLTFEYPKLEPTFNSEYTVLMGRNPAFICRSKDGTYGSISWDSSALVGQQPPPELGNTDSNKASISLSTGQWAEGIYNISCDLNLPNGNMQKGSVITVNVLDVCNATSNWLVNGDLSYGTFGWSSKSPYAFNTSPATGAAQFTLNSSLSVIEVSQEITLPRNVQSFVMRSRIQTYGSTLAQMAAQPLIGGTLGSGISSSPTKSTNGRYIRKASVLPSGVTKLIFSIKTLQGTVPNAASFSEMCIQFIAPNASPEILSSGSQILNRPLGASVSFRCPALGFPQPSITWSLPTTGVISSTTGNIRVEPDGTLSILNLTSNLFDQYICVASNYLGSKSSVFEVRQTLGSWTSWSTWGGCMSTQCGALGVRIRTRTCSPVNTLCRTGASSENGTCPSTPSGCPATTAAPVTSPTTLCSTAAIVTSISNGLVAIPGNTTGRFGDSIVYVCNTGYYIASSQDMSRVLNVTCLSTGHWSYPPTLSCILVTCPSVSSKLANGIVQQPGAGLSYNQTVIYTCNSGYYITGQVSTTISQTLVCQANGTLSGVIPTCSPTCPQYAMFLPNGMVFPSSTARITGTNILYVCAIGYHITGELIATRSLVRTCRSDGQWNSSAPTCSLVTCPSVSFQLVNGIVQQPVAGLSYNQTVIYTCNSGYYITGQVPTTVSQTLVCQANGTLSGVIPTCSPVDCKDPGTPSNGRRSVPAVFTYSSSLTFTCVAPYVLTGVSSIVCQADGTWSGPLPACQLLCANFSPVLVNGTISTNARTVGTNVIYLCDIGYQIAGTTNYGRSVVRACTSTTAWNASVPTCSVVDCGDAGTVAKGSRSVPAIFTYNSRLTYTCNIGYLPIGDSSIVCQADQSWSGPLPTCQHKDVVTCPSVSSKLANGIVQQPGAGLSYNQTVIYTCNSGYYITGQVPTTFSHTLVCQANGTLSGVIPTCSPTCPQYTMFLPNGMVFPSSVARIAGTNVLYLCAIGYHITGELIATRSLVRTCRSDGQWNSSAPTCSLVTCPSVSFQLVNGIVQQPVAGLSYNQTVIYTCNSGYYITGQVPTTFSQTLVCQANGTLSGVIPTCSPATVSSVQTTSIPAPTSSLSPSTSVPVVSPSQSILPSAVTTPSPSTSVPLVSSSLSIPPPAASTPSPSTSVPLVSSSLSIPPPAATISPSPSSSIAVAPSSSIAVAPSSPTSSFSPSTSVPVISSSQSLPPPAASTPSPSTSVPLVSSPLSIPPPAATISPSPSSSIAMAPSSLSFSSSTVVLVSSPATFVTTLSPAFSKISSSPSVTVPMVTHSTSQSAAMATTLPVSSPTPASASPTPVSTIKATTRPIVCSMADIKSNFLNGQVVIPARTVGHLGDTVENICNMGFYVDGQSNRSVTTLTVRCQLTSQWSYPPIFGCAVIECPLPTLPFFNGQVTGLANNYLVMAVLMYSCDPDYHVRGSPATVTSLDLVCQANGMWSNPFPVCQLVSCGDPGAAPSHSTKTGSAYTVNSMVQYQCDQGYRISGSTVDISQTITCGVDGTWSAPVKMCQLVSCGPPNHDAHSTLSSSVFTFGSTVTVSCNPGFVLSNGQLATLTCTAQGVWDRSTPACNPVQCPPLPGILRDLTVSTTGRDYQTTVTFTCNVGYHITGQPITSSTAAVTCLATAKWDNSFPTCTVVNCADPNFSISNGAVTLPSVLSYNQTAIFTCNSGYRFEGGSALDVMRTAVCMANGTWSTSPPNCTDVACGAPGTPVNGATLGSQYTYNSSVSYSCTGGHNLIGASRVTCLLNGTWSAAPPLCQVVTTMPQTMATSSTAAPVQTSALTSRPASPTMQPSRRTMPTRPPQPPTAAASTTPAAVSTTTGAGIAKDQSGGGLSSQTLIIIAACGGVFIIILAVVVIVACRRGRRKYSLAKSQLEVNYNDGFDMQSMSDNPGYSRREGVSHSHTRAPPNPYVGMAGRGGDERMMSTELGRSEKHGASCAENQNMYEIESHKEMSTTQQEGFYEVEDECKKPKMKRKESLYEVENELDEGRENPTRQTSTSRLMAAERGRSQPSGVDEDDDAEPLPSVGLLTTTQTHDQSQYEPVQRTQEEPCLSAVGLLTTSQTYDQGQYEPVQKTNEASLSAVGLFGDKQNRDQAGYEGVHRADGAAQGNEAGYIDVQEGDTNAADNYQAVRSAGGQRQQKRGHHR